MVFQNLDWRELAENIFKSEKAFQVFQTSCENLFVLASEKTFIVFANEAGIDRTYASSPDHAGIHPQNQLHNLT